MENSGNCPVWSWNEWDPLEEVIVGIAECASVQPENVEQPDADEGWERLTRMSHAYAGSPFPLEVLQPLVEQIEGFVEVLKAEGVVVKRPQPVNLCRPFSSPYWTVPYGYNLMNPRDMILVVGNQIIESPSPLRHRYFESCAYRKILHDYSKRGARWIAAPRPALTNDLYDLQRRRLTETEPVFEAADFVRCGRDIFYQLSKVTNRAGVEWLQQYLGDGFRFHEIETQCPDPLHIDTTFVPIGPGKALINPEWVKRLPDSVKSWDIMKAPAPEGTRDVFGFVQAETSMWIAMNVFLIDEQRIFVECQQETLIRNLKDWGFKPIPIPFSLPPMLGGAFHCTTLDVRRRGEARFYCD